jgi:hypothetical protein
VIDFICDSLVNRLTKLGRCLLLTDPGFGGAM